MLRARRVGEGQVGQFRHQLAGGEDGVDRLFPLREMSGPALQLDDEGEGRGVHRHGLQIGWLAVDEMVGAQALANRRQRADAALQLAHHIGQDDVASRPNPGLDQRSDGAQRGRIARLHVRDADAVDEILVDQAAPGIDGPSPAHRVGVEVAVEHQALAAAAPAPDADGVDPFAGDGLEFDLQAKVAHHVDDMLGERLLARTLGIALPPHQVGQCLQAGGLVDAVREGQGVRHDARRRLNPRSEAPR